MTETNANSFSQEILTSRQNDEVNRILTIIPGACFFVFTEYDQYSFCDANDGNAIYFMTSFGQHPMTATYIKL
jgi:hypothetical protein